MKCPLQREGVVRRTSDAAAIVLRSHDYAQMGVIPSGAWCEEECRNERSNMSDREFQVCLAQCRLN